jgi:PKD repeat protein
MRRILFAFGSGTMKFKNIFLILILILVGIGSANAELINYDGNLVMLLHNNGVDGSSDFIDDVGHTVSSFNATINTTTKKFGSASGNFSGTDLARIQLPSSSEFSIASKEFTISMWVYFPNTAGLADIDTLVAFDPTGGYMPLFISYSDGAIKWYSAASGATSWNVASAQIISIPTQGVWEQYVIRRNSTHIAAFKNGVEVSAVSTIATLMNDSTPTFGSLSNGYDMPVYIDEIAMWNTSLPISEVAPQTAEFTHPPDTNIVPIMTSDTTPTGNFSSAASVFSGYPAWWSFDRNNENNNRWSSNGGIPTWIQIQLSSGKAVQNYSIVSPRYDGYYSTAAQEAPRTWELQASNDGATWIILDTQYNISWDATTQTRKSYEFYNTENYKYYRLYIKENNNNTYTSISQLEMRESRISPASPITSFYLNEIVSPYSNKTNVYKGQLHAHTANSDGTSSPTVVSTAYKNAGYNFLAITDHAYVTPDPGVSGILHINGSEEEARSPDNTTIIGYMTNIGGNVTQTSFQPQSKINGMLSNGSIPTIASPLYSPAAWDLGTLILLNGYKTIEVFNGGDTTYGGNNSEYLWDSILSSGTQSRSVYGSAVDDMHDPTSTVFNSGWVMVYSDALDCSSIKQSLNDGNYYSTTGAIISGISVVNRKISLSFPNASTVEWITNGGIVNSTNISVTGASYTISDSGYEKYVRARITDNTTMRKAWTNPIFTKPISSSGQSPHTVKFVDATAGSPTTWNWSCANITGIATEVLFSQLQNPEYTFGIGNWSIRLNASNSEGYNISGYNSSFVNVSNIPSGIPLTSDFTGTPLTGHAPLDVTFTDESTGTPDSWNWSFGDGDILNGKPDILTHTYVSKGLYSVNLSVGNNTAGNSSLVKTDYINVLNASELYPSFNINAVSGYKPFVVIVNDTSTNFNATINTLEWDFVEGSTHTIDNVQNTSFTYNSTQVPKYVKLTITNSSFGIWNSTSVNITATDVSGFTQQDIWMDPQYILTLHVADSATGLVIPDVSLTDSSTTYLTTNGTFILTYPYSTVVLTLASTGYAGKQVSYVMDSDREETVQLSEKSASTSTTWYTPKTVQFSIVDVYGNQLKEAVVNANYNETTLPKGLSDLINNYGMNSDSANDALNGTLIMHGSTDSQGNIVFTMLSTIKYDVNVTYGGNTNYYSVYPQDSQYQLKFIVPVTTDNIWDDLYASGNTKVWATEPDIGNVTFHWSFQDMTDLTTRIDFYLKDVDLNTTVYMTNVTSPVAGSIYQLNYTVLNERGKNYIAWENYTRSV